MNCCRRHIRHLVAAALAVVCLWCCPMSASAVSSDKEFVDSILALITPQMPDSSKARLYHEIARTCNTADIVVKYGWLAVQNYPESDSISRVFAYNCIMWAYQMSGKSREAINVAHSALALCGDDVKFANSKMYILNSLAVCYDDINRLDSSLSCQNEALDLAVANNNSVFQCFIYQRLAILSLDRRFTELSNDFIDSLEAVSRRHNFSYHIASAYYLRSRTFVNSPVDSLSNLLRSVDCLKKAISVYDTINVPNNLLSSYFNTFLSANDLYMRLASLTGNQAYSDTSYYYYQKCSKWYKDNGVLDYISLQGQYANYLLLKNRPKEALKAIKECEPFMEDSIHLLYKQTYYRTVAACYHALGNHREAIEYSKKMVECLLLVHDDAVSDDMSDFRALTYAKQRKKLDEIERQNIELKNNLENRHSQIILYFTIAGLLLLMTVVAFLVRSFTMRRRTNGLLYVKNSLLSQQREEIEVQRDVLAYQTASLEKVNRRIMSSVNYAKRIQVAAIPSESEMRAMFPQSFVFFCPKSVVSGDFYYIAQIEGYRVVVLADCTGHGIPGGFLSMLGIFGLKEFLLTKEDAHNPGVVLGKMKDFVTRSLSSQETHLTMSDGMDMTICSFAPEGGVVRFASANQPAVIVSNGEVTKLVGDSIPVGKFHDEASLFTTSEYKVSEGDMVYLFSDGVYDQIGGRNQNGKVKRLQRVNLEQYLIEISSQSIDDQADKFHQFVGGWRGDCEQTDDMLLIGIKV
ncbi:MAG: SpoIIE family protein phosphatase [Bacteroidales bacterium]|nr:SpoIIE family protein phosphatase [Bacteroidales bacterium]